MLLLAAVFPWLGGGFYTRLAIEALLLGSVALSVDILLGYAGLLSLGQAAYFGLAAYISALMYLHVTQSFWLVLLTVASSVGVFSFVLGAVAIRAKGVYFALITFGAAEILSKIAHNTRAIGGSDGLIGIPVPTIPLFPGFEIDSEQQLGLLLSRARRDRSDLCRHAPYSEYRLRQRAARHPRQLGSRSLSRLQSVLVQAARPMSWRRRSPPSAG